MQITGTVRAASGHAPLQAMVVAAYDAPGKEVGFAKTDVTGLYVLSIPAGSYRLLAYDPAGVYATVFGDNASSFETTPLRGIGSSGASVDFMLMKGGDQQLGGELHARGRAGDVQDGVSDPQLVYATQFWGGASFRTATPVNGAPNVTGIDMTPPRAGRVSGLVRANGLPVAGIQVAAYDSPGMLASVDTSDAAGRYAVGLAPGSYRLLAFHASLTYATAYAGGPTSFEATVGIEVLALDAAGNRVAAATSNEGTFTIVLRPGMYRFTAVDPEGRYNPAESASVTVSEGQLPSVVLTLEIVGSRRRSVRH